MPKSQEPMRSPLRGIKLLNMGKPGTGKTHTIKSIMDSGLDCYGIFTEPGADVITGDSRLKFAYIAPQPEGWETLEDIADKSNTMIGENIKKMNLDRSGHKQFFQVLSMCKDFIDERTGKHYGPIESWGTDRCFCFDSLTGLVSMVRGLVAGAKPALTWPEYDTTQQNVLNFVNKLFTSLRCHVYLTAHIDMIVDEISGMRTIMAHTLGKAISPIIHVNATDAVLSTRAKLDFKWSAAYEDAMVKAQNMPMDGEYPQDFGILLSNWVARGGIVESGGPSE